MFEWEISCVDFMLFTMRDSLFCTLMGWRPPFVIAKMCEIRIHVMIIWKFGKEFIHVEKLHYKSDIPGTHHHWRYDVEVLAHKAQGNLSAISRCPSALPRTCKPNR